LSSYYFEKADTIWCESAIRFEQEKAKIQAWEEHEKAKAEAEMRRIEVQFLLPISGAILLLSINT